MKKVSIIVVTIISFFLVGCSANDKKASLSTTDVNEKVIANNDVAGKSVSKEKIEKKEGVTTGKIDKQELVKGNIKKDSSIKTSSTLNNNKTRNLKVQKNNVGGIVLSEVNLEKNTPFKMGMSIDTVRSILKKNNIKVDNEVEVTTTLSDPNWGNKILDIKNISLEFNKKNHKLFSIEVLKNNKTSLGLGVGDSIVKMKKLYGTKYTIKNLDNIRTYTYKINNHYFSVHEQNGNGKISSWSIKKA